MFLYKSRSGRQGIAFMPAYNAPGMVRIEAKNGSWLIVGKYAEITVTSTMPGRWWRNNAHRMLSDVALVTDSVLYDSNGTYTFLCPPQQAQQVNELISAAERQFGQDTTEDRCAQLWKASICKPAFGRNGGWVYTTQPEADTLITEKLNEYETRDEREFRQVNVINLYTHEAVQRLLLPTDWPGVGRD